MKFAYLIEPPFNFRSDDGEVTGCDVELARSILADVDAGGFEPVETEFAQLLPGLAAGKWRMTTGLFATAERRRVASFSRPIWALSDGLLVRKHNPKCLAGYLSIAGDNSVRLAVILLFVRGIFGWGALIAASIAFVRPNVVAFGAGVVLAILGLVLYNTRSSALAVALLVLTLARPRPSGR